MKKSFWGKWVIVAFTASFLLTGCGSSKGASYATENMAAEEAYDESGIYEYKAADFDAQLPKATGDDQKVIDSSRKLITTMNISAEAENLDEVLESVNGRVKELGGYVESSNI